MVEGKHWQLAEKRSTFAAIQGMAQFSENRGSGAETKVQENARISHVDTLKYCY